MKLNIIALAASLALSTLSASAANPLVNGWNADPEAVIVDGTCWIYPTINGARFDAYSSTDLVNWTRHENILDTCTVSWAHNCMWAPAMVHHNSRYYFFFSANDVHQGEIGGIGVAVADNPAGPFTDALGHPLIGEIINGAQPIDQYVFRDDDGQFYMYYGGWGHCNVVRLSNDLMSVVPFDDGTTYREITPKGYVEGPFMLKRNGKYYFMWSEGSWTGPDYRVAYAISTSPFGPFERIGTILQKDDTIATGAGHHSVIQIPGTDEYYIVYHRRPIGDTEAVHRQMCIDPLIFDANGFIKPVVMTHEGIGPKILKAK